MSQTKEEKAEYITPSGRAITSKEELRKYDRGLVLFGLAVWTIFYALGVREMSDAWRVGMGVPLALLWLLVILEEVARQPAGGRALGLARRLLGRW